MLQMRVGPHSYGPTPLNKPNGRSDAKVVHSLLIKQAPIVGELRQEGTTNEHELASISVYWWFEGSSSRLKASPPSESATRFRA